MWKAHQLGLIKLNNNQNWCIIKDNCCGDIAHVIFLIICKYYKFYEGNAKLMVVFTQKKKKKDSLDLLLGLENFFALSIFLRRGS